MSCWSMVSGPVFLADRPDDPPWLASRSGIGGSGGYGGDRGGLVLARVQRTFRKRKREEKGGGVREIDRKEEKGRERKRERQRERE